MNYSMEKIILEEKISKLLPACDFPPTKRGYNYLSLPVELRHLEKNRRTRKAENRLRFIDLPNDLNNKTVLDLGCNIGTFSIEALKRKAKYVLGIDAWQPSTECFLLLLKYFGFEKTGEVWNRRLCKQDFLELATYNFDYVFAFAIIKHLKESRSAFWDFTFSVREKIYFEGHARKELTHYLKEIPKHFWDVFEIEKQGETEDLGLRSLTVFKRKK